MREGWEIKKIGDVCLVIAGQSPAGKFYNNEGKGLAFYQGKKEFSDKYIGEPTTWTTVITKEAEQGDILMSVRAPVGPINYATTRICIGRGLTAIRSSKMIDKDYLFYFLLKHESEIVGNAGAVFNSINKNQIESINLPVPSITEQLQIVSILDEAFAAIDKAKANIERNLRNAKELFQSELDAVFSQQGEGWVENKLNEISQIKPPKKEINSLLKPNDLVTFLPMEDLAIEAKVIKPIKEKLLADVIGSYTYFADNDVLLAKITPCFENGKVGIARNLKNAVGFGSSEYIVFRCKDEVIPDFLYYFLSRKSLRDEGSALMTGAVGHKRVSKDWIENYIITYPSSTEKQKEIVHKLNSLSTNTQRLVELYQKKLNELNTLKKSILQKAFSGELKPKT